MKTRIIAALCAGACALALAGCSQSSGDSASKTVTLVTHNDFSLPESLIASFEKESGLKLKLVQAESGAKLVNKLKLTKAHPIGDAVFGIATNDMASVAKAKLLQPIDGLKLPHGATSYVDKTEPNAVPIDRGDLCLNIDPAYFADKGLAEPKTFDDLVKPEYKGMTSAINASKVTGFAFLAATIAHYGPNGWQGYWKKLKANDVHIAPGWSEAYNQDFTQGEGKGGYPIVVSYASSPALTVTKDGTKTKTKALLDTCYQQVEYSGILTGAKNPDGARKVIEWLLSKPVQQAIPDAMFMYPVDASVKLPASYKFAPLPKKSLVLPAKEVADHQQEWVKQWTDIVK